MNWTDFYLFCFAFGFFFSLVTVLTGHMHFDFGSHGHVGGLDGGHGHFGHDAHAVDHGDSVSPFNFGTLAAFLAWFGGTGYLMTKFYRAWYVTTLMFAMGAGVVGGWLVYLFLSKVLIRSREHLDPADYDMVGVLGQVSETIRADGIGEILFSQAGSRRASPARSEDGSFITNGTEVVVTRYEKGIAYVRRWDELTGEAENRIGA